MSLLKYQLRKNSRPIFLGAVMRSNRQNTFQTVGNPTPLNTLQTQSSLAFETLNY